MSNVRAVSCCPPIPVPPAFVAMAWLGQSRDRARFFRHHLWIPLASALCLAAILMLLDGDFWVADRLYGLQGHTWTLKNHPVTESMIHLGGKRASAIAWLIVVAACWWTHFAMGPNPWRRPLLYLAVTSIVATGCVGLAKSVSNMDCPWDLLRYGGDRAFVGLFEVRPAAMPAASCFPAGHASAGYAWTTLYFFFLATRPRLRWVGLASALAMGATFGFSQQLRGAHFISDDLWTLVICWLTALAGYLLYLRHPMRAAATEFECGDRESFS